MKYLKFKINSFINSLKKIFLTKKKTKKKSLHLLFLQIINYIKIDIKKKIYVLAYNIKTTFNLNVTIFICSLIFFLYLIYISVPGIIYNKSIQNYLTKILQINYHFNFSLSPKIKYSILPKPHFEIQDVIIFNKKGDYEKNFAQIKKLKIFLNQGSFLKKNNLQINYIEIYNSNFFVVKSDLEYLQNFFEKKYFKKPLIIKKSTFFYKDDNDETVALSNLKKVNIYKDSIKNQYLVRSNGEIFNLPFIFNWKKDDNKFEIISNIKFKKINFSILNQNKNFMDNEQTRNIQIKYNKSKYIIDYKIIDKIINFSSSNSFVGTNKLLYSGTMSLNPFSFDVISTLSKIKLEDDIINNILLQQIISKKFLLNKNFNGKLKIKSDNFLNNPLFNKIDLKVNFVGENIDLSDTILTNEKIAKLNFLNSKLYEDKNNIFLKSSFELQILDRKKFYNKFVVAKANRVDLETINFDLIINLTKNNIKIVNIVIPELKGNVPNEKLDNLIYEFNSGGIKVSNWIELKNFTNLIISSYAG